jgi:hypothetical protein
MKELVALLESSPVQRPQQPHIVAGRLLRAIENGVIDQESVGVEEDLPVRRARPQAQVDVVKVREKATIESA